MTVRSAKSAGERSAAAVGFGACRIISLKPVIMLSGAQFMADVGDELLFDDAGVLAA